MQRLRFPEAKMAADAAATQDISDAVPRNNMISGATPILPAGKFSPQGYSVIDNLEILKSGYELEQLMRRQRQGR